jgi:hypothetical protein
MAEILEIAPSSAPDLKRSSRVVLESFKAAPPKDAFDTAVLAYRRYNPNVPSNLARRAVAKIICEAGVVKQP